MVVTFLMGTKKLYDFCDKNPMCRVKTGRLCKSSGSSCAELKNLVCINACVQVDFMGQIVSEVSGPSRSPA